MDSIYTWIIDWICFREVFIMNYDKENRATKFSCQLLVDYCIVAIVSAMGEGDGKE